jgi:DNA mismatch repair protein MutS
MEQSYPGVKNFNVSVKEIEGKVVFLRKLKPGGSEHSFGIHVAKLAGMPRAIVDRANAVLRQLEEAHRNSDENLTSNIAKPTQEDGMQLSFFQLDDPVLAQIRDELLGLDINNLSPLQALNKLSTLREILLGK